MTPDPTMLVDTLRELCEDRLIAYHSDLDIDAGHIAADPACPFLHFTRTTGTVLVDLPPAESLRHFPAGERRPYLFGTATREERLADRVDTVDAALRLENHTLAVYHDGRGKLRVVDAREAARLVRDYAEQVRRSWRLASLSRSA